MQCYGRTKLNEQCKNHTKFLLCKKHVWQPFVALITFIVAITTFVYYATGKHLWSDIFHLVGHSSQEKKEPIEVKEEIVNLNVDFKNLELTKLLKSGWTVLHPNVEYLNKGLANKTGLELYTLPGDYWVIDDKAVKRYIENVFTIPLPQANFKAEIEIKDFESINPHEQAGFILVNDTSDLSNNIRYTITDNKITEDSTYYVGFQHIYSISESEKNLWGQSFNKILDDTSTFIIGKPLGAEGLHGINRIWLQVAFYNGCFIFEKKVGGRDRPYILSCVLKRNFKPKFLCLAAFQGLVNNREKKVNYNPVSAIFTDLHISNISEQEQNKYDEMIKNSN